MKNNYSIKAKCQTPNFSLVLVFYTDFVTLIYPDKFYSCYIKNIQFCTVKFVIVAKAVSVKSPFAACIGSFV